MTNCPYHHLDPAHRVIVWYGRDPFPMSAELACQSWHDAQDLKPIIDGILERFSEALDRLADS